MSLFGIHNLTSDAEGDDEMPTISRKELQKQYQMYKQLGCLKRLDALMRLFGSKCLPDEKIDPESLVTTIKDSMEHPLPDEMLLDGIAEPKYKRGDNVMYDGTVQTIVSENIRCGREYYLSGVEYPVAESDLKPYVEPEEDTYSSPAPINFDDIERRDRKKHRTTIAAMAMQGILANGSLLPNYKLMENEVIESVASLSVRLADALIAECRKGGTK